MDTSNVEFKIKSLKQDIDIQDLEVRNLKITILSHGRSLINSDSSKLSKINKNSDVNRSSEISNQYVYQEKLLSEGIKEEYFIKKEDSNKPNELEQRIRENEPDVFHSSDLNKSSSILIFKN